MGYSCRTCHCHGKGVTEVQAGDLVAMVDRTIVDQPCKPPMLTKPEN
ncbi:MAG: hypothetical protein ACLTI1_06460 [Clostridia bacterium]